MKAFRLIIVISSFMLINTVSCFATYTLADVIKADSAIADHTPSPLVAPISGKFIILKDGWYQIRLFSFEAKSGGTLNSTTLPTFLAFIKRYHQEDLNPKAGPETLFPTDYFSATPQMKEDGFNYLLSLRKVADPSLIRELNASRAKESE
jgi:hypothetical protein